MRNLLFNKHLPWAAGLLLWAGQSWAGPCWPGAAHPEGDSCANALTAAETQLTDTLAQVETMNSGERLSRLLSEQQQWLRQRDQQCRLPTMTKGPEHWRSKVLADGNTANCVINMDKQRVVALRQGYHPAEQGVSSLLAASQTNHQYPRVKSTLGDLLADSLTIPYGAFKAHYFDRYQPRTLVASDMVRDISVNYSGDSLHRIKAENFGGYWGGRFYFASTSVNTLSITQNWGKTRVIIDKTLVFEGNNNLKVPYTFTPGDHLIEVEFLSGSEEAKLDIDFGINDETLAVDELKQRLSGPQFLHAKVIYVGVQESSDSRERRLKVNLQPNNQPVILLLNAYGVVHWQLDNPHKVQIKAIAYGSANKGSSLSGSIDANTVKLELNDRISGHDQGASCDCSKGRFSCSSEGLPRIIARVKELTGKNLYGFSGQHATAAINTPELLITPTVLAEAESALRAVAAKRAQCQPDGWRPGDGVKLN